MGIVEKVGGELVAKAGAPKKFHELAVRACDICAVPSLKLNSRRVCAKNGVRRQTVSCPNTPRAMPRFEARWSSEGIRIICFRDFHLVFSVNFRKHDGVVRNFGFTVEARI